MAENEKVYLYVTTPLDGSLRKFSLLNVEGTEYISGLFHFTLTLTSSDSTVDFKKVLGKNVTVVIEFYNEKKRYINGVVTKITQAGNEVIHTTYFIEIKPWLWELTLTSDSRIYQEKTTLEIIKSIFQEMGFTDFKDKTTQSYKPRVYCVQYQESAFNFVSRLMEEEGIFYFFEHSESAHTLILADDKDAHVSCAGLSEAKMQTSSFVNDEVIVSAFLEQQLTSNQYAVEDYNFEMPSTDLLSSAKAENGNIYRIYEYPARYLETSDGEQISKKRLDSCIWNKKTLNGESLCRAFIAGYKFKVTLHQRADINTEYVINCLSISADQKQYSNEYKAFPSDVQFRALPLTRKPRIHGTQTALVVGKNGEELWTDKYGRIKVQFYWDQKGKKDENSSCWIRVAQTWAGKSWGVLFTPRIGMEVVVSFLEGDPDRPLITGCVYNAAQALPYALPTNQNKSTILSRSTKNGSAGNEIRYEDTKGSEEFFMHAQKDMNIIVENERTATIKESNETLLVQKGDRTVKVEKGKEIHEVQDTRSVMVTGNETHTDKADFTHKVTGNYTLNVDGNLAITVKGSISIKSDMDISEKAGTSISTEAGTSISNKAGTTFDNKASVSMTNDGGVNLTDKASAIVKIDAGAMLEAKGGIIKLN
jgi:type VI secretion system secreted protein VgrG